MKKIDPKQGTDSQKVNFTLSIADRINFPSLLPVRGSRVSLALKEALIKKVALSPAEIGECGVQIMPDRTIRMKIDKQTEFCFEHYEFMFVQQGADFLDKAEQLEDANVKLADRILKMEVGKVQK